MPEQTFVFTGSNEASSATRGKWNEARRLESVLACLDERPFEQPHGRQGVAWD